MENANIKRTTSGIRLILYVASFLVLSVGISLFTFFKFVSSLADVHYADNNFKCTYWAYTHKSSEIEIGNKARVK